MAEIDNDSLAIEVLNKKIDREMKRKRKAAKRIAKHFEKLLYEHPEKWMIYDQLLRRL